MCGTTRSNKTVLRIQEHDVCLPCFQPPGLGFVDIEVTRAFLTIRILSVNIETPLTMKALTSVIVASAAASLVAAAEFTEVALEAPLNWVVGSYLWPAEIIAGYNDLVDGSNWTDSTWDAHILAECETYTACTSSITWQGRSLLFSTSNP